jgi:hypothetical protein
VITVLTANRSGIPVDEAKARRGRIIKPKVGRSFKGLLCRVMVAFSDEFADARVKRLSPKSSKNENSFWKVLRNHVLIFPKEIHKYVNAVYT